MNTSPETNHIVDRIFTSYSGAENADISETEIKTYIQSVSFLEDVLRFSKTAFLIVEYPKFTYPYVSANLKDVMGWDAELFRKGGPAFGVSRWHPKDLKTQEQIHPAIVDFFLALSDEEKGRYKFAFTSRIITEEGKPIMILQNNFFLKWDDQGNPLMKLITVTDISSYKKDTTVVFYVTRINGDGTNEVILQKSFPESEGHALSKRELEIVRYISDGLSSPEIGLVLNISKHTVKIHRKNAMRKLGCTNTAQLIALVSLYGLVVTSKSLKSA